MEANEGFDNLLTTIGFGNWQAPIIITAVLIIMQLPIHLIGSPLMSAPMAFHCSFTPPSAVAQDVNYNHREHGNNSYFNNTCLSDPIIVAVDQIAVEEAEAQNGSDYLTGLLTQNGSGYLTGLPTCPYIEYDTSIFASTVVSQWNLVCEQSNLQPLFQMMYSVGGLLGSTIGGHVGDRFGRKRAILIGWILYSSGVVLMTSVPFYPIVLALRVLTGITSNLMLLPAWNLALESSPLRYRSLVGMLLGLPYSIGVISCGGIAYRIRSWKNFLLVCASPIIFILPFAITLDESPRWLIQQGRVKEAKKILKNAVKKNNAKLSTPLDTIVNKLEEAASSSRQVTANGTEGTKSLLAKVRESRKYFRSSAMRIILLAVPVLCFCQSFLYLSVAINANNFTSTGPFLYVTLTGVMDGSAILLSTPLATRFGRKIMIFCGMFMGAILFLLDLLVSDDYFWAKWVLVMTGFLLVSSSYQVSYIYGPELFPTEIRTRGFALLNVVVNIGFICAPLVTGIFGKLAWWSGGVFFGCAGILGSLMVPFLPETRNKPLPDTLQDVEDRRNNSRRKKKKNGKENKGYDGQEEIEV